MSGDYAYDHAWEDERVRLSGLEDALDPGTCEHLLRLGAGPGKRCLEVGAGGGAIAFWLAERVAPGGSVVATDLETDFLEAAASRIPTLDVLRHDLTKEALPGGFDLAHARYLIEWLPKRRDALRRMVEALRPGGALLIEEPDFVTTLEAAEPPSLRRVMRAALDHLESISSVDVRYGRHLLDDLTAVGLADVTVEGRCPIVRGGSPPAGLFLRLTVEKFRVPLLASGAVEEAELDEASAALLDPERAILMPMTFAGWGWRR
jgi:SAM-dependent methyltransferase